MVIRAIITRPVGNGRNPMGEEREAGGSRVVRWSKRIRALTVSIRASIMASFKPAKSLLAESEKERECGASVWPDAGLKRAECTPFVACAAALFPIGCMHCCLAM